MDNEKELKDLTERVIAAGGRAGRKAGVFLLDLLDGDGCKRGDEHPEVAGLFFWYRSNKEGTSRWVDEAVLVSERQVKLDKERGWAKNNPDKVKAKGKRWRQNNPDKVVENRKRYYEENREKCVEKSRRYREENREKVAEYQRGYREGNREKVAEYNKRYKEENKEKVAETAKRYYEENRERCAERNKDWHRNNPEKVRAKNARRRARKLEAFDPSANQTIIESRYQAAKYLGDVTGIDWDVDHTQPLNLGGKEYEDNLQVVPRKWNQSKGARHNDRWEEDSNIYRYATAVEKRFEREAIAAQGD